MKITDLLNENAIQLNGVANSKQEVIDKLIDLMQNNGNINNREEYRNVVVEKSKQLQIELSKKKETVEELGEW